MNNGYKEFWINNIHYYEHRFVAEQMLGRKLLDTEIVHHIDVNRSNNSPENLMLFKSTNDHTAFHKGAKIYKEGDVWVAKYNKTTCPICGGTKDRQAKMCVKCSAFQRSIQSKSNRPDKETLNNLIQQGYSLSKIGRDYNITGNAVKKWCKYYKIPHKKIDS